MKTKQLFFIVFLLLSVSNIIAQNFGISLNAGFTPTTTVPGTINFYYVDESPSQDNLQSEVIIDDNKRGFTLSATADYKMASNIYLRLGVEGLFGKVRGIELNLGGGYEVYNNEKFFIRPLLMFSTGDAGIKLGDIYQNDVYIEVNGTKFYSESVSVKLRRSHLLVHPEMEFGFIANEAIEIFANVGYQFPINIKGSFLVFDGKNQSNENTTAKESIKANNVGLYLNNEQITSNYIGVTGLAFRVGFKFKI